MLSLPRSECAHPRQRPPISPLPFVIECRMCRFEPLEQDSIPRHPCPKCHCSSWQRSPRPGSLLWHNDHVASIAH